jgi:hypothetical protein
MVVCRQIQAMQELCTAIQIDEAVAEEAPRQQLASQLTQMLRSAEDEPLLNAIGGLLAALSGAGVHARRTLTFEYPGVGEVHVADGPLGDGVGARLWGISHRFNAYLAEHRSLLEGQDVLEVGSGVGSTGARALEAHDHCASAHACACL